MKNSSRWPCGAFLGLCVLLIVPGAGADDAAEHEEWQRQQEQAEAQREWQQREQAQKDRDFWQAQSDYHQWLKDHIARISPAAR